MRAVLSDGGNFRIGLTGAAQGFSLQNVLASGRPPDHLSYRDDGTNLLFTVRPEILFLDIRDAVRAADIDRRGLSLQYLIEQSKGTFAFDRLALKTSLDQTST